MTALGPFLVILFLVVLFLVYYAVRSAGANREEIAHLARRLDALAREIARIDRSAREEAPTAAEPPAGQEDREEETPTAPLPEPPAVEESLPMAYPLKPHEQTSAPSPEIPQLSETPGATEKSDVSTAAIAWWATVEDTVGKRWMTWAGALALFLGAGFFVKYAIDHRWIGPTTRVLLGSAFGIILVGLGCRFLQKKMRALGQGLVGGGLAILYVSLFAAFEFYALISQPVAFALMVLVSATGMSLAVIHDAMPISFLAVLGGLLTPVMVSTGRDERDLLFTYLLLLNLSVLGLGFFRKWRALDVLAFVGTAGLFSGWFVRFYTDAACVPALLWLGAFYVIFLVLPFAEHLRRRTPVTLERFVIALVNAAGVFAFAHRILHPGHSHVLGFIALGMGASYLLLGVVFRRRVREDARSLFGFFALAMMFLTISVPIHFDLNAVTLCWAAEGPVLLYLGYRYRYRPVRVGGLIVLGVTTLRLFSHHMPLHSGAFAFEPIWNTEFATAMCVPLACTLFAVIHHLQRRDAAASDRWQKVLAGIAAGFLALIVLHVEVAQFFRYASSVRLADHRYYAWSCASILWSFGALGFLLAGYALRSVASRRAGVLALLVAVSLSCLLYGRAWRADCLPVLNLRFVVTLVLVLATFGYGFVLRRCDDRFNSREGNLGKCFYGAGILFLLMLLSAEAFQYCSDQLADPDRARWTAQMSLTVIWSIYAMALLVIGFWRRVRSLRLAGLALFGLAAAKLVAVDISRVEQIYRIVSFVALGLLMIAGSYLYHRVEKVLAAASAKPPAPPR